MPTTAEPVAPLVSDSEIARFRLDGYAIARGLFRRDEIAEVAAEAQRLVGRTDLIHSDNIRCRWKDHATTKACLFECFDPVIDIAPACARLANDPRLVGVVTALLGETACLFKDKLILKPPGAVGYDLQQDYIAWPNFPRSFTTAAVAIDPSGANNGATQVFTGYHLSGCLSPEDGDYHSLSPAAVDPKRGVMLDLEPGDVAIFGAFTPHRSAPNWSDGWRRLLYLSYNARSDGGDYREQHYREFHEWLKKKYAQYGKHDVYFR